MKTISKIYIVICSAVVIAAGFASRLSAQVQAPDPVTRTENITIKLDALGDASWEVDETMNQAQWEQFKSGPLVNDPSVTKRNMERALSTFVIEDFNRDLDEMNRTVKMTFKVKAAAQYNGNGNWTFKLESKNPQVSKLADNSYLMTSNMYSGNDLLQQTDKIFFPDGASNIQQTTDSFGKAQFTYSKGGGLLSYLSWSNILGFLFIAAAVFLVFWQQQQAKTLTPQPTVVKPAGGENSIHV